MDLKEHWETIDKTKQPNELSWTQEVPAVSLEFMHKFHIPKLAKIIDIGGGDSKLVDFLLAEGYSNVSVLDISQSAILRAQERLGKDAKKVNWIVCDMLDFKPKEITMYGMIEQPFIFKPIRPKSKSISKLSKKRWMGLS